MPQAKYRHVHYLLIGAFFLALLLPLTDSVLHLDPLPRPSERRTPAGFPHLPTNWKEALAYPAAFDAFYSDNFGWRSTLVRGYMDAKVRLFHASPISWSVLGKDDWCFLAHDQALKSFWDPDPSASMDGRLKYYEKQRAIAEKYGAKFMVAFGPDKASIYPEYLPSWMQPPDRPGALARLADYMHGHSKIPFLDLTDTLIEAKKGDLVYNPVESHWNGIGAYAAYKALLLPMRDRFPQLPEVAAASLRRISVPTGGKEVTGEIDIAYFDRFPYVGYENSAPTATQVSAAPLVEALPELKGKTLSCFENKNKALPKILVFHDSFGYELRSYLPESFGRAVFLLENNVRESVVDKERPDIVLMVRVERALYDYTPRANEPGAPAVAPAQPAVQR